MEGPGVERGQRRERKIINNFIDGQVKIGYYTGLCMCPFGFPAGLTQIEISI